MSTYYKNENIILNANMAQSIASPPIDLSGHIGYCIQAVWTGTPSGTIGLQVSSDDPSGQVVNWSPVTDSQFSISGASGNDAWNVLTARYQWVQLVYTPATAGVGSGILNARVNLK